MLPGGDSGFDLCRRICDMQEFSSALVIFLTARASETAPHPAQAPEVTPALPAVPTVDA